MKLTNDIKSKKLLALSKTTKNKINTYDVPVIRLFSIELSYKELNQLSFGLDQGYIDKSKYVKQSLAANFKSFTKPVDNEILNDERKDFHKFLKFYCDIFTKNVCYRLHLFRSKTPY